MPKKEGLSASLEDYLEVIFHIAEKKGAAKARDIAESIGVSRASVTGALQTLGKKGLINYAPYDVITLTDQGRDVARDVVKRHEALRIFFESVLGIDPETAEESACSMEHAMNPKILKRMEEYLVFIQKNECCSFAYEEGQGFVCTSCE